MITDVTRLSSIAHDEEQYNHSLCACLWIDFEGQDFPPHSKSKYFIENNFNTSADVLMDSLHKFEMHMQHRDSQHGMSCMSTSTLHANQRSSDESITDSSRDYINNTDRYNIFFGRRHNQNDNNYSYKKYDNNNNNNRNYKIDQR